jgi:raffinose/stachyose/melibiose transport system substrate-binding protein
MKRYLIFTLIFIFTVSILLMGIGCKAKPAETLVEEAAAEEEVAEEELPEEEIKEELYEKEEEVVTLKFIHWRSEDATAWEEFNDWFEEENPNIKIDMEITTSDIDEYMTILKTRLAGNQVDFFLNWVGTYLNTIDDAGYCYDFSDEDFIDDYLPASIAMGTRDDGRIVGINQGFNIYCINYNKKMFSDYGFDTFPKNYDEFVTICNTFRDAGIEPVAIGNLDNWVGELAWASILGAISPDVNPITPLEKGEIKLTDEPFASMVEGIVKDYENKIYQDGAAGTSYDASLALFAQEQTPMLNSGTWAIGGLAEQNPDLDQGVFVPQAYGYDPVYNIMGNYCVAVNPNSPNLEAALKYVRFMATMEATTFMGNRTKQMQALKGVELDVPELQDVTAAIEGLKGIPAHFTYILYPETATILNSLAIAILDGTPADEAVAFAQAELDDVIASQ